MQYAQIRDGIFIKQYSNNEIIEWDSNNKCTPGSLIADGKGPDFGVVELISTDPLPYNRLTQRVERDGAEFVNGNWRYKWKIVDLEEEQINNMLFSIRLSIVLQIKDTRDKKTQTGGFPASGKWFHSDTFSRTQQMALLNLGTNMPTGIMWKTMDSTFVEMTPALIQDIFQAAIVQDMALFQYAETLINLVNNSSDPYSIDINSGWPQTFEEV